MNKKEIEDAIHTLKEENDALRERLNESIVNRPTTWELKNYGDIEALKANIIEVENFNRFLADKIDKLEDKLKEKDSRNSLEKIASHPYVYHGKHHSQIFTKEDYLEFENECLLGKVEEVKAENTYLKNAIQEINQLSGDIV